MGFLWRLSHTAMQCPLHHLHRSRIFRDANSQVRHPIVTCLAALKMVEMLKMSVKLPFFQGTGTGFFGTYWHLEGKRSQVRKYL